MKVSNEKLAKQRCEELGYNYYFAMVEIDSIININGCEENFAGTWNNTDGLEWILTGYSEVNEDGDIIKEREITVR